MIETSELDSDLEHSIKHLNKIHESTESLAHLWFIERKCSEFSNGKWIDPEALLKAKYPDLDLTNERDILAKHCWESSAVILQRHYPEEFGYREWKPKTVYRDI